MNIYTDIYISYFDFLVVIVLGWAIYRGYKQGAIIHSVALLVFLAGIGIAAHLSYAIYGWVQHRARVPLYNLPVILFFIFAVGSAVAAHFVGLKVQNKMGKETDGFKNRLLGVLVNTVKYLYMISVISIVLYKLDSNFKFVSEKEKQGSHFFIPIMNIAPYTFRPLRFKEKHPIPRTKQVEQTEEIDTDLEDL